MVEANPWWRNLPENATLPACYGPTGVKADGGGSMAGRGRVGPMRLHRAANLRDAAALKAALAAGDDVNEVESAGNTPLHNACYEGWLEGVQLLLEAGAKVNASNNAGDRPYHWAEAMLHDDVMKLLQSHGADESFGQVIVPEHIDKIKDFYAMDEGPNHPLPSREFMDWREAMDKAREDEKANTVPGLYVD